MIITYEDGKIPVHIRAMYHLYIGNDFKLYKDAEAHRYIASLYNAIEKWKRCGSNWADKELKSIAYDYVFLLNREVITIDE